MPKYKVGDVAALFSKPKEPTSEAGKKLQSLFNEFHIKNNKSNAQFFQNVKEKTSAKIENEETGNQSVSKMSKKRKFSDCSRPGLTAERNSFKTFKETNNQESLKPVKNDKTESNFLTIPRHKEKDFPRNKKKKTEISTVEFHSNGIMGSEDENPLFDTKQELNTFPKSNKPKGIKEVSRFTKKAKPQNEIAATQGKQKSEKNCKKQPFDDDDDDILLKSEIMELIKSAKNVKRDNSNVGNFMQNSQPKHIIAANDIVQSQDNEKCKSMSNEETFNDNYSLFKDEIKDFVRSTKTIKKKKSNEVQLREPDFIKVNDDSEDKLKRTLFIGNLPVNTSIKALKALFSPFGEIESIRYHGIETDKAKIFGENGNKLLNPYKYAADSVPGFIVFTERESAVDALALSGTLFKDHHITVDFALPTGSKKLYDEKRSIFIGNLPFDVKDEKVWEVFTGYGRIEAVRIIRDRETGIGKGFGYVLFSTIQSKENALALEDLEINGRKIRIKPVDSNKKTQNKSNNTSVVKRNTFKSQAIKIKKKNKDSKSRKSTKKIMKKQKSIQQKKKIAQILQKSMK